jgi:hypothetical protein
MLRKQFFGAQVAVPSLHTSKASKFWPIFLIEIIFKISAFRHLPTVAAGENGRTVTSLLQESILRNSISAEKVFRQKQGDQMGRIFAQCVIDYFWAVS